MSSRVVDREALIGFLARLDHHCGRPGRAFLVGETSQLLEGWRRWASFIELTLEADDALEDGPAYRQALEAAQSELDLPVVVESPAEVIPLPDGWEARARPAAASTEWLSVFHFDPYSVSFRFIARGDEPDYHLVLQYLSHGWVTVEAMEYLLESVLPRFTAETIAQDPAEFRRRYKGLLQMWHTMRPGATRRET
ncbi:MAG: hypothetical protein KAI98_08765 [Gemmatimonadetes bacterium]|nr:hypothetical protein [Gemmatimonadota bacterium]MCK5490069.1 hypothetical protein [Gemmatimonadota bacterium]